MIRRKRNEIVRLKGEDGRWLEKEKAIVNHIVNHFSDLFTSTNASFECAEVKSLFPRVLNYEDNNKLTVAVIISEIKTAMKQLRNLKAPGPDGLQVYFFGKYWDQVGPSVIKVIRDYFNNGFIDPRLNTTFIAFIPKKVNPMTIKEYRPINLCNYTMKIITKIIANRIRPLLDKFISPNQHAFITNRSIFDSTVICNEIIHSFKRKKGSKGWMALKLDFDKAYDSQLVICCLYPSLCWF